MLFTSVITQKKVKALVNTKSIAMKWPRMSATTNFSRRNINTIAPEYRRLLLIVWLKRLERIEDQPDFLTLRQIPKHVSKMIAKTAIKTSGLTGARIEHTAKRTACSFVLIRKPL